MTKEVTSVFAKDGQLGNSRKVVEDARVAGEVIEAALPELFAAYDAERSRMFFGGSVLNSVVREGISNFYDGVMRHNPDDRQNWLTGSVHGFYKEALNERRKLTLARAEEHFRHPGILPPLQRHPIAALVATNLSTALLTFLLTMLGRALVP
jgi:hypothetical protein